MIRNIKAYALKLRSRTKRLIISEVAIAIIDIITDEFSKIKLLLVIRFKLRVERKKVPFLKRTYQINNNKDTLGTSI